MGVEGREEGGGSDGRCNQHYKDMILGFTLA